MFENCIKLNFFLQKKCLLLNEMENNIRKYRIILRNYKKISPLRSLISYKRLGVSMTNIVGTLLRTF